MKLLVVIPCYFPAINYGGPVIAVHQMNKALIESGVEVTVFTTNAYGAQKLDVPLFEEVNVEDVKVHYFPMMFGDRYFYSPSLKRALKQSIKEFDLVHINWMYAYPTMVAARLCARVGVPYILTPHGMLDAFSSSMKSAWKKKVYVSMIEKPHILKAAAVHFCSKGEEIESVVRDWPIDAVVVPNGIILPSTDSSCLDGKRFVERYPEFEGKKLVLFIGRLNYIKGLDLLLKAWPDVIAVEPDAHLVIAGPDSDGYLAKLQLLVNEVGVSDSVTFTGMVLGEEKELLLKNSSVFVSSSYLESFGMAIVEAMAYGLPVVVTDRANIKEEIIAAHAGLVSRCDSKEIASKLLQLLKDEDGARAMGIRGQQLVRDKFDMNSAAKDMLSLYQKVIEVNLKP
ncbi:glycosyltransferase [Mariprofundus erugo]|uniref:glycosyltransferase n=1 Tax=Mariprofundus erugo TaxID=2528639 RepID=UPI0010FD38E1|nr:glycosyltransferase [Mariprofundus erugo]TLS78399.1 glycosyltransferase [Mariprofundus erugo]